MHINTTFWVPEGRNNEFIDGFEKLSTLDAAQRTEWLSKKTTLQNQDVVDTIYHNKIGGYFNGVRDTLGFVTVTACCIGLAIHIRRKFDKLSNKNIKLN